MNNTLWAHPHITNPSFSFYIHHLTDLYKDESQSAEEASFYTSRTCFASEFGIRLKDHSFLSQSHRFYTHLIVKDDVYLDYVAAT